MRQDFLVPQVKETDVPSLSQDKGITGQAQHFATGRDGPGRDFDCLSCLGPKIKEQ